MRRSLHLLTALALFAIAVPLVPFLLVGARLDHAIAAALEPPPPRAALAALEVGILAVDLLLPVPSSVVATLGGAHLGLVAGTACAALGMTLGAAAGWWLGRAAGHRAVERLAAAERDALDRRHRRLGPLFVVLTRPVPLVAEAAAILAGAAGMRFVDFLVAAAAGNLAIAAAWTAAGVYGARTDALQWILLAAVAVPVAAAWLVAGRGFWHDRRPSNP